MKKSIRILALLFAGTLSLNAQQSTITVISNSNGETVLRMTGGAVSFVNVTTPRGTAVLPQIEGGSPMLKTGAPELEKLTASVIIPDRGQTSIEIVSSTVEEMYNVDVAPSKGNFDRSINPASVPYTYGELYNRSEFFPAAQAELRAPYIARDFRGQTVVFHPFRYNPATRTLLVYREMVVKVKTTGGQGINEFNRTGFSVSPEFRNIYGRQFVNYPQVTSSFYTPVGEQGEMLLIAPASYMGTLQPFIDWKMQRGIKVTAVDVATIGNNAAAIKAYIANFYNNNTLAFVLLAGDAAQVTPSQTAAGPSDNDYTYIVGSDHYPDCFIGRFSAENTTQLATMVTRTISYERNPVIDPRYAHCLGIASDQGPGDDNELDYEHQQLIGSRLLSFTYTNFHEVYDGSQGGGDAPGNPNPADVTTVVNAGVGIINYTGHGSASSFSTSGFSSTQVDQLTNTQVWPFIFSVACVNGDFVNNTCFAEHWIRAKHPTTDAPTGAVAVIMSTINQSWNPPMEGQDEMNEIMIETFANNIKRSFGGITMNGCMKMNDTYGGGGEDMTDTWTIFGDPSVMVRTKDAVSMTVSHAPSMILGATSFNVACSMNDAQVTLWQSGQILGTGTVSGGNVTVNFAVPVSSTAQVTVTAVAFNCAPYQGPVSVIPPAGPYVQNTLITINDPTGNNNNLADYSENVTLDVTLQNIGVASAGNVTAVLSTTDANVTITDNTENYGTMNASATQLQANAYGLSIANNVTDQHIVPFTLTITDAAANTWTSTFNVTLQAPVLGTGSLSINDPLGNNNSSMDPGETFNVLIPTGNTGHSNSVNAIGVLSSTSPFITINNNNLPLGVININGTVNAVFSVTLSSSASIGAAVDLNYVVTAGAYSATANYQEFVSIATETFETNSFTQYPWTTAGNLPWITTTDNALDGIYCSKSGAIGNSQTSEMSITVTALANDSISFWYAVSSEDTYDFLKFYIDNQLVAQWSGAVNWTYTSYAVTAGTHTFRWVYEKDYVYSDGQDCAWIDNVTFPPSQFNVGISELPGSNVLNMFPNPATDNVTFTWNASQTGNTDLVILDAAGRIVAAPLSRSVFAAGEQRFVWSTEGLSAGVYFVRFTVDGETSVSKLIKN
ncbi:MAG: C25 family cysteine peptidase [Bacteroidota bacterium]